MYKALLDNDVVAKGTIYNLLQQILACLPAAPQEIGLLGTLRYVLSKKKLRAAHDGELEAHKRLISFIDSCICLEPNDDETLLAAELEEAAKVLNVQLDIGESQLCAIAVKRGVELVCTGDKRAIAAMETLRIHIKELAVIDQRVLCLESLVLRLIARFGYEPVRAYICSSCGADTAIEICFQCHNTTGEAAEAVNGLRSYENKVRSAAPNVCLASGQPVP